jgi:hypothetical protein
MQNALKRTTREDQLPEVIGGRMNLAASCLVSFEFVFRNLRGSSPNLGQGYGKKDMSVNRVAGIPFGTIF